LFSSVDPNEAVLVSDFWRFPITLNSFLTIIFIEHLVKLLVIVLLLDQIVVFF
jgi:hypothetical protein